MPAFSNIIIYDRDWLNYKYQNLDYIVWWFSWTVDDLLNEPNVSQVTPRSLWINSISLTAFWEPLSSDYQITISAGGSGIFYDTAKWPSAVKEIKNNEDVYMFEDHRIVISSSAPPSWTSSSTITFVTS